MNFRRNETSHEKWRKSTAHVEQELKFENKDDLHFHVSYSILNKVGFCLKKLSDWNCRHLAFENTFRNSKLAWRLLAKLPKHQFNERIQKSHVMLLRRGLSGLRRTTGNRFNSYKDSFMAVHFKQLKTALCIYCCIDIIIERYINYHLIFAKNHRYVVRLKTQMSFSLKLHDLCKRTKLLNFDLDRPQKSS